MILAIHAVAGAAVANQFQNKLIAWILAFLSHFLLDAIPHREYSLENAKYGLKNKKFWLLALKIILDLILGFILIIIFTKQRGNIPKNLMGGFFSLIPDGLTVLFVLFRDNNFKKIFSGRQVIEDNSEPTNKFHKAVNLILSKFYRNFHNPLHWFKQNTPLFWGVLTQFIIFTASLITLAHW